MKIEEQAFEKLIIMNCFEVTFEKFIESYSYTGSSAHPKYANGYLIYFSAMEDTEYHQRLQVENKTIIWDYLEYVKLDKFQRILKNKKDNSGILVQDMSSSPFFVKVGNFLKNR